MVADVNERSTGAVGACALCFVRSLSKAEMVVEHKL